MLYYSLKGNNGWNNKAHSSIAKTHFTLIASNATLQYDKIKSQIDKKSVLKQTNLLYVDPIFIRKLADFPDLDIQQPFSVFDEDFYRELTFK